MSSTDLTFQIDEWLPRCKPTLGEDVFSGAVSGPYNACLIEYLRRRFFDFTVSELTSKISTTDDDYLGFMASIEVFEEIQLGKPQVTDVFVFAHGESPFRRGTKVGGLPYFPLGSTWPCSRSGAPLPFLCQFDFHESKDHVGDLIQGDMLLLFGGNQSLDGDFDLAAVWVTDCDDSRLIRHTDVPIWPDFDPFHGYRWRTLNYPDVCGIPSIFLPIDDHGGRGYMDDTLFSIHGTQISRAPYFISSMSDEELSVLCSLTSVIPYSPGKPFSFINKDKPININSRHNAYDSSIRFFEFGRVVYGETLYVLVNAQGEIRLVNSCS